MWRKHNKRTRRIWFFFLLKKISLQYLSSYLYKKKYDRHKNNERINNMALKIGIFSLKDNVGCTAIAIHMANYLAGSESSVSLVEPATVDEPEFGTAKADFEDNGTFVLNNVRYYPSEVTVEPDEDIQIYDFGKVNYMFEFPDYINKLYVCVSNDNSDLNDVVDFINETGADFEVIMIGGTKNLLQAYSDCNLRSIIIGDKKEPRIDRRLADRLNFVLRRHFIKPPEYHGDWEYAPTIFHYVPEEEAPKKGLFGSLFGSKKKEPDVEQESSEDTIVDDIEEIIDINDTGVSVAEKNDVRKANEYVEPFEFDFSNIPVPVTVETQITDEVSDSIEDIVNETVADKEISVEAAIDDKKTKAQEEKAAVQKEKELKKQQELEAKRLAQAEKEAKHKEALAEKEAKKKEALAQKEAEKQQKLEAAAKRKAEIDAARLKSKEEREAKRKEDAERRRKMDAEDKMAAQPKIEPKKSKRNVKVDDDMFMDRKSSEPLYRQKAAKGILGDLIKEMKDKEVDISNIFIVTHSNKLFIFDNVELFYSKLGPLQREIKDPSEIDYMILTFKDYDKEPLIMSENDNVGDVYSVLEPLDEELKRRVLDDDDIRRHKELVVFDEILYA